MDYQRSIVTLYIYLVNDWKNNTIYENYTSESQIIRWFWEIVEAFDNDDRAEFLQFVTGILFLK